MPPAPMLRRLTLQLYFCSKTITSRSKPMVLRLFSSSGPHMVSVGTAPAFAGRKNGNAKRNTQARFLILLL